MMFGFGKRSVRTLDEDGRPVWTPLPYGTGFYRTFGGSWKFRTPLDRLLGRPGSDMLSHGISSVESLPPGTLLRCPFGSLVGDDGRSVVSGA
jgi:hypothetical protein